MGIGFLEVTRTLTQPTLEPAALFPPPGEVKCRRCGRVLKNPKARAAGIGPVCVRKEEAAVAAAMRRERDEAERPVQAALAIEPISPEEAYRRALEAVTDNVWLRERDEHWKLAVENCQLAISFLLKIADEAKGHYDPEHLRRANTHIEVAVKNVKDALGVAV